MANPADTPYGTVNVPLMENVPGHDVPPGGTTGQVLTKASNANYDTDWEAGGGGGSSSTFAPVAIASVSATEVTSDPPSGAATN